MSICLFEMCICIFTGPGREDFPVGFPGLAPLLTSLQPHSLLLRDSASSFHWLSSSIFSCRLVVPHSDISSYLHYMMFPSIQTIYFL